MKYYGRTQEQKRLQAMFDSDQQNVTLVYGRRRVGKSELIKEALKRSDGKSIYYECKQTSEQNNASSIAGLISENCEYPKLALDRMEEVLRFLFKQAEQEPWIFVLDEYAYAQETVKGLDSILQSLIDQHKDTSKLKLVICGSFVNTMRSCWNTRILYMEELIVPLIYNPWTIMILPCFTKTSQMRTK